MLATWWRRWRQKQLEVQGPEQTLPSLARQMGLDRRRHSRVRLPLAREIFPSFNIEGIDLPLVDLSVGGVCVRDPQDRLTHLIGQNTSLALEWPHRHEVVKARVVGVSRHSLRHLQFLDLSPESAREIAELARFGDYGARLKPALSLTGTPARLQVEELWVGTEGDSLIFYGHGELVAELTVDSFLMRFYKQHAPRVCPDGRASAGTPAVQQDLARALAVLGNIEHPSTRLLQLIEGLVQGQFGHCSEERAG